MSTIERILVGLDEGNLADGAIAAGLRLSERLGGICEFIHAVERPSSSWSKRVFGPHEENLPRVLDAFHADAARRIRDANAGTLADAPIVTHEGRAADVIVERARTWPAELIVLGSHKRRGRIDFGGTARSVLARSACPVWVQPGAVKPVHTILVPIEGTVASYRVLEYARLLAQRFGARAIVYHCFRPPGFAYEPSMPSPGNPTYVIDDMREHERAEFESLVRAYDWGGVSAEFLFEEGEPGAAILEHQHDTELIVMGTHSRSRVARALLGSTAYEVLKRADVPVLAIPLEAQHYASE